MFSNMELDIQTKYHSRLWVEIFTHVQDFQKLTFWEFFLRKLVEDVLKKKKKESKSGRRKLLRDPGKQKKMATRMPRMTVQKNKKIQSSNRAASLQSQHRRGQVRKLQARKRISKALLFTEYFTCDVRVGNETFWVHKHIEITKEKIIYSKKISKCTN